MIEACLSLLLTGYLELSNVPAQLDIDSHVVYTRGDGVSYIVPTGKERQEICGGEQVYVKNISNFSDLAKTIK